MGEALRRLAEEDPTFVCATDENTGQTLIAGMGELHLEVLVDRMMREYRVQANVGRPRWLIARRSPRAAKDSRRFMRQSGGRGQYGDVWIGIEPREKGEGLSSLRTPSSAVRFRGNIFRRLRRASGSMEAGMLPVIPWSM